MAGGLDGCQREESLRVIVADGDAFARRLIKGTLRDAGMTVVAEAGDGREALELSLYYRPDVIVIDAVMPGLDGIQATRRILRGNPDQLVVVLTGASEEEFGLRRSAQAPSVSSPRTSRSMRCLGSSVAVHGGEAAVSRAMTGRLIERYREQPDGPAGLRPIQGPLTAREWEVVDLLKPGHSTDRVADTLVISTETVRSHLKNIMRKLGVHSRADAVAAVDKNCESHHPTQPASCGDPSLDHLCHSHRLVGVEAGLEHPSDAHSATPGSLLQFAHSGTHQRGPASSRPERVCWVGLRRRSQRGKSAHVDRR